MKECPVVMGLHEFAPVGGRATSGRDGRRLEWFAEVCENLPDRHRFRDEGNEPDVTAALSTAALPAAVAWAHAASTRAGAVRFLKLRFMLDRGWSGVTLAIAGR